MHSYEQRKKAVEPCIQFDKSVNDHSCHVLPGTWQRSGPYSLVSGIFLQLISWKTDTRRPFLLIVIFKKKRIVYFNLLRQIKDEHCYIRGIRGEASKVTASRAQSISKHNLSGRKDCCQKNKNRRQTGGDL